MLNHDIPLQMKTVKIVLLGDSGVGKTSLLDRYVQNQFHIQQSVTSGSAVSRRSINIKGEEVHLQLWDTAGQEKYRSITSMFYRGAHAVLLVFDVTNPSTLDAVTYWHNEVQCHCDNSHVLAIFGNKTDSQVRELSPVQIDKLAAKLGCKSYEVSAATGHGVVEAMAEVIEEALKFVVSQCKPLPVKKKEECC